MWETSKKGTEAEKGPKRITHLGHEDDVTQVHDGVQASPPGAVTHGPTAGPGVEKHRGTRSPGHPHRVHYHLRWQFCRHPTKGVTWKREVASPPKHERDVASSPEHEHDVAPHASRSEESSSPQHRQKGMTWPPQWSRGVTWTPQAP